MLFGQKEAVYLERQAERKQIPRFTRKDSFHDQVKVEAASYSGAVAERA